MYFRFVVDVKKEWAQLGWVVMDLRTKEARVVPVLGIIIFPGQQGAHKYLLNAGFSLSYIHEHFLFVPSSVEIFLN